MGYPGHIVLVSEEQHGPYQRPPLSKAYLLGETTVERLQFRPKQFYADNGIELRLSSRAVKISRPERHVLLEDGSPLHYDHLVLATGARARVLPNVRSDHSANVHYMRTLEDADRFGLACREGCRLLIVGGGYIGLEAAAVARKRGAEVTVVEAASRILQRVAAPQTADFFRDLHRRHGVDIREGVGLHALTLVDGWITAATLDDGRILPIDAVIAGIGVLPNQELAAEAGLRCDNGIVVDASCKTSDPRIMAIGDCARIPDGSGLVRLESVGHAIEHGHTAAAVLMGKDAIYRPRPWFWSDQFEVKLQIAGVSTGYDRIVVREQARARRYALCRAERNGRSSPALLAALELQSRCFCHTSLMACFHGYWLCTKAEISISDVKTTRSVITGGCRRGVGWN